MSLPTIALLRRLRREMRYRALPRSRDEYVMLESVESVLEDVAKGLQRFVPGAYGQECGGHPAHSTLRKGLLQLSWPVRLHADVPRVTSNGLRELGYVVGHDEDDDLDPDDEEFLELALEFHMSKLRRAVESLSHTTLFVCARLVIQEQVSMETRLIRARQGIDASLFPIQARILECCIANTPQALGGGLLFY